MPPLAGRHRRQRNRSFFLSWCFMCPQKPTIQLIRDGRVEVREEGDYIPIATHCHHQNYSCIKMGSDESHFNVSLIEKDKVTRQCP